MLRQEDPHPTPDTTSAAQTRVTPEELAHAIATLEARKLDDQRHQDSTIPIGEAVRELNLDATPEEVLAEVRAQREAQSAVPPPAQSIPANSQTPPIPPLASVPPLHQTVTSALRQAAVAAAPGLKQAALAASPALKQGMEALSQRAQQPKQAKRVGRGRLWLVAGIIAAAVAAANGINSDTHVSVQVDPPYRLLSTVPDGHEVYTDMATVVSIAQGAPPQCVPVEDGARSGNTWRLIRHDKHWYVRGYVLRDTDFSNGTTKVYNNNDAGILEGQHQEDVTLRLDTSKLADTNSGDNWSEIDLSQVHPDTYTHEDW